MKNDFTIIERFLYKLLIATCFLLTIVILDKVKVIEYDYLKEELSDHFNVIEVIKAFNGENLPIIPVELNEDISVNANYLSFEEIQDGVKVNLGDYEAVEVYRVGVVIKIFQNDDKTYKVSVLGSDDYEYIYDKLESIDCHIYKMVATNEIIGKAKTSKESNFFHLYLFKDGKKADFLSMYES